MSQEPQQPKTGPSPLILFWRLIQAGLRWQDICNLTPAGARLIADAPWETPEERAKRIADGR